MIFYPQSSILLLFGWLMAVGVQLVHCQQLGYSFVENGPDAGANALWHSFEQNSIEQLDLFKTKIFKLIEAQNQYFEIIQQKRPNSADYDYSRLDIVPPPPGYDLSQFDNQDLLSWPSTSVSDQFTAWPDHSPSQLLFTVDYQQRLHIWQFFSSSSISLLDRWPLTSPIDSALYDCVKIRSFMFPDALPNSAPVSNHRNKPYRAHVLALFRRKNSESGTDYLVMCTVLGYLDAQTDQFVLSSFHEEQTIRFEQISDFDILFLSPSRVYLGLVRSATTSNHKTELLLYTWSAHKFDLAGSQESNYVRNAYRVKLSHLNDNLYLICSHRPDLYFAQSSSQSSSLFLGDDLNSVTFFQVIRQDSGPSRYQLSFVSAISNSSLVGSLSDLGIFHLADSNDFLLITKRDSVDVYWWDGLSPIYYDTLTQSRPSTFSLYKLSNPLSMPPLILSSDGLSLQLYEKRYQNFNSRSVDLRASIRNGYSVNRVEVFPIAGGHRYQIWVQFTEMSGQSFGQVLPDHPRSYSQFIEVEQSQTDSQDDIVNLDTCLTDLRNRIENGIGQATKLTRTSENLLVISPQKPIIEVDVIVNDTFRTQKSAPNLRLSLPNSQIVHGKQVQSFIQTTEARLKQLTERLHNGVVRISANQSVLTPVQFARPFTTSQLVIDQVNSDDLYLNEASFAYYANSCLTLNTDQLILSDRFEFHAGLEVDHLRLNSIHSGPDFNEVLMVRPISGEDNTRFVSHPSGHQYLHLELLNGTTAPSINEVRLLDIFQDSGNSVQLLKGCKHFVKLSGQQLTTDSGFNQVDFRRLLSDIVWLSNDQLSEQTITTANWTHLNQVLVDRLTIANKVNAHFDVNEFVKFAARSGQNLSIEGPIFFQNVVNMAKDLQVDRSIDGIDFYTDVVLLKGDQNFVGSLVQDGTNSNKPGILNFAMFAEFEQGLTFDTLNGLYKSDHFVLRHSNQTVLLPGKHFSSDLRVLGNVNLDRAMTVNNVDLSELFDQLDTLSAFNTPLQIGRLVVNGPLYASYLNRLSQPQLNSLIARLWLRNTAQSIPYPFDYQHSTIYVRHLRFASYRNGLQFPQDYFRISTLPLSELTIQAPKFFSSGSVSMANLHLGPVNGTINGHRISQLYQQSLGHSNRSQPELITGRKSFNTLVIRGNLYLRDGGLVNDKLLARVIRTDAGLFNREVAHNLHFSDVFLEMPHFGVQDLLVENELLGHHFEQFIQDVVQYPGAYLSPGSMLQLHHKHFAAGVNLESIESNGTVGMVNVRHLLTEVVTLDSDQNVYASINFHDASFTGSVDHFESINQLPPGYFHSVVRKDATPAVHIWGQKYFSKDVVVGRDLYSYSPLINSHLNLTHLVANSLMKLGDQIIDARHHFLRDTHFVDLHLPLEGTLIRNLPLSQMALLNSQSLTFSKDVVFENLYRISNLNVIGKLNNCHLDSLIATSTFRNQTDLTFNLAGHRVLPQVTVKGDLRLSTIVNDQGNFISQIVTVDDRRAIPGNLVFLGNVWSQQLHVNHLINGRNLSSLLRDAVYVELPQRIVGRKYFRKPIEIIGFVSVIPERGQLKVGGLVDQVNVSNLFLTTVRTDRPATHLIQGRKLLTGRITLNGNVSVGHSMNGLRVPEDLVLTYTNELITGETVFTKRVHVRQNLNAQLINHVNLTRYVEHCVRLDTNQDVPITGSTFTFVQPVQVHNLTVLESINDIPVDQLIARHNQQPVIVSGRKTFRRSMFVDGQLTIVRQVNGIDFDRDIKQEFIDLDPHSANGTISLTGMVTFDRGVQLDNMNIHEQINQISVRKVNSEHISQMESFLHNSNQTLQNMFQGFGRSGRSLQQSFVHQQLTAIKYLELVQTFETSHQGPFWPVYSNGFSSGRANALLVTTRHGQSGLNCVTPELSAQFNHQLYSFVPQKSTMYPDTRFTSKPVPGRRQQLKVLYPLNPMPSAQSRDSLVAVLTSDQFCSAQSLQYQHQLLFTSNIEIYLSQSATSGLSYSLEGSPDHSIKSARLFVHLSDPMVYYSLVHFEPYSRSQSQYLNRQSNQTTGRLWLYRYRKAASSDALVRLEQVHLLPVSVLDFDLVLHRFLPNSVPELLLSIAGTSQSGPLFVWNQKTELFEPVPSSVPLWQSSPYRLAKFVSSPSPSASLYLLLAGSVSPVSPCCSESECSLEDNQIDVYQLFGSDHSLWFSQRLYSHPGLSLIALESVLIDSGSAPMIYFFALTSQSVHLYQHRGVNHFEPIAQFGSDGANSQFYLRALTAMTLFWGDPVAGPDRLYLALSSSLPGHSHLAQVLLTGHCSTGSRLWIEQKSAYLNGTVN